MTKRRVLIIDPEEASINYLAQAITKAGYQVFTCSSGKEGLILAWKERPHILIIDPNLSDYDYQELIYVLDKFL